MTNLNSTQINVTTNSQTVGPSLPGSLYYNTVTGTTSLISGSGITATISGTNTNTVFKYKHPGISVYSNTESESPITFTNDELYVLAQFAKGIVNKFANIQVIDYDNPAVNEAIDAFLLIAKLTEKSVSEGS